MDVKAAELGIQNPNDSQVIGALSAPVEPQRGEYSDTREEFERWLKDWRRWLTIYKKWLKTQQPKQPHRGNFVRGVVAVPDEGDRLAKRGYEVI